MKFLPYEKYSLTSVLTPEQINDKLLQEVETKFATPWSAPDNIHHLYCGTVQKNQFIIRRIMRERAVRHPFHPVITGKIEPVIHGDGSRIKITMHLEPFTAVLISLLWLGVGGMTVFAILRAVHFQLVITALGMLAFVYGPPILFFNLEISKSKKFLDNLFQSM